MIDPPTASEVPTQAGNIPPLPHLIGVPKRRVRPVILIPSLLLLFVICVVLYTFHSTRTPDRYVFTLVSCPILALATYGIVLSFKTRSQ
jgi:hypothetical protein